MVAKMHKPQKMSKLSFFLYLYQYYYITQFKGKSYKSEENKSKMPTNRFFSIIFLKFVIYENIILGIQNARS
jgi:hypothetical protein